MEKTWCEYGRGKNFDWKFMFRTRTLSSAEEEQTISFKVYSALSSMGRWLHMEKFSRGLKADRKSEPIPAWHFDVCIQPDKQPENRGKFSGGVEPLVVTGGHSNTGSMSANGFSLGNTAPSADQLKILTRLPRPKERNVRVGNQRTSWH
jgi:hypothetical protein